MARGEPGQHGECGSCQAPVIWARNVNTSNVAPLDAEPVEDGNCAYQATQGTYSVLNAQQREAAKAAGVPLRKNHFATCPQARAWVRSKDGQAAR